MMTRLVPYDRLLDDEVWAFIERSAQFYPPDAVSLSVEEQRAVYDALCGEFHMGRPAHVTSQDLALTRAGGMLALRRYECGTAQSPAEIVFFHGGGFVVGGLDSHDDFCADLCAETGLPVTAVDYRLAPEHPHPAAFDDAVTATAAVAETLDAGQGLILVGDSAGGTLAAAVAQAARAPTPNAGSATLIWPISGTVLIYPALGGDPTAGSYVTHAHAPMLTTADIHYYGAMRTGGSAPDPDPTLRPLDAVEFAGLPPTLIVTAGCDPLRDDGRDYAEALQAARVDVEWIDEPGLVHGFLRARGMSAAARESVARIFVRIRAMAGV